MREAVSAACPAHPPSARGWVPPDNYHVTLKFIGGRFNDQVIRRALQPVLSGGRAFSLQLAFWGGFPNGTEARILWVGVGEGADHVKALALSVEDALVPLGVERDIRPFQPHVTVARDLRPPLKLSSFARVEKSCMISEVHLLESHSGPPPLYEVRAVFPLNL